jgi:hypothetical protein
MTFIGADPNESRHCTDRVMTMSTKTTTKSSAPMDEAEAVSLLKDAGYHVASLKSGGYVVIDLADMSTASECLDLGELLSVAKERAEETWSR